MNRLISHLTENPAPFYLLYFPLGKQVKLESFWQELIAGATTGQATLTHPDVLWLKPEKTSYSSEDLEGFQKFLQMKCFALKRKIVIWDSASALSVIQLNKLLKDLEQPGVDVSILMAHQDHRNLPSTLTSRALSWRLQIPAHLGQKQEDELCLKVLEEFAQGKLTATTLSERYFAEKQLLAHLWQYVLKAAKHKPFKQLKRLQDDYFRYLRDRQWNHLKRDHFIDVGHFLENLN